MTPVPGGLQVSRGAAPSDITIRELGRFSSEKVSGSWFQTAWDFDGRISTARHGGWP